MTQVTISCDRCGRTVHGIACNDGTSGFYKRGPAWKRFMVAGEHIVCDDCMQHDLDYQREYPPAVPPVEDFYHAILVSKDMPAKKKLAWLWEAYQQIVRTPSREVDAGARTNTGRLPG